MTYAIAFGLVWVWGCGVALPLVFAGLTLTKFWGPWTRVGVAFLISLAWPVLALGWLVGEPE